MWVLVSDLSTYLDGFSMFHVGVQVVTLKGPYIYWIHHFIWFICLHPIPWVILGSYSILLFVIINILLFNKYNLSKLSLGLLTFIRLSEHCPESSPQCILTYKWCNPRRRPWHYQLMQSWHQYHIGNSYWSCYRPLWRTFKS